jgi:hypothetical protein
MDWLILCFIATAIVLNFRRSFVIRIILFTFAITATLTLLETSICAQSAGDEALLERDLPLATNVNGVFAFFGNAQTQPQEDNSEAKTTSLGQW